MSRKKLSIARVQTAIWLATDDSARRKKCAFTMRRPFLGARMAKVGAKVTQEKRGHYRAGRPAVPISTAVS